MNDKWDELIDRHLRGELTDEEKGQLAEWLDADPEARREFVQQTEWDTWFTEVLRAQHVDSQAPRSESAPRPEGVIGGDLKSSHTSSNSTWTGVLLGISLVAVIALSTLLYLRPPSSPDRQIVTISGMGGSLIWIGNDGQIVRDVQAGTRLPGGTLEGMTPNSWCEIEFDDDSTVMISGHSMLTFSDRGQKKLRLKEGAFSANVSPQPVGKPMLIQTRSAVLEVLGTKFEVEASLSSTVLNVNEGKVRATRRSDGDSVEVSAKHRVIASADGSFKPERVPETVDSWVSQLQRGPQGTYGEWSAPTSTTPTSLRTIPYTITSGPIKGRVINTVAFRVSSGDQPPVMTRRNTQVRIQGQMVSPHDVFVGVTLRKANGEFAGRFQFISPAKNFVSGKEFQLNLKLSDFHVDPSLKSMKSKLPAVPFDLIIETIWCHTLFDPTGFSVSRAELSAR